MENFTPAPAAIGGTMIGLAAALLWLGSGRIAGISGMVGKLLPPASDALWRGLFLLSLVAGCFLAGRLVPGFGGDEPIALVQAPVGSGIPTPVWLAAAGLLIGFGTRIGNGCTSGHGVCGLGRLSLRSLAAVAVGLIAWSGVMVLAERRATQARSEADVTIRDGLLIGLAQCIALVPGVSRSGATISAGLLLGLDRVSATRMAFFLGIPALMAAGLTELPSALVGVEPVPVAIGAVVSFLVGYASIAWLLRLVASRSIVFFVPYRVALGVVVLVVLAIT